MGRIPAGKYHRLSCKRHLEDLKRFRQKSFPFAFDKAKAQEALDFFPKLEHHKGRRWKGTPFELSGWQIFCIGSIYGWVEKATGLRRFERAYIEVPKKNGKTFTAAAIGNKQAFFDLEPGSEVYSIATMRDQAKRLWEDARQMVEHNKWLKRRIETLRGPSILINEKTNSKFQPLGKDSNSADGVNPYCVLADELHRHRDDELLNVMTQSMTARDEPLIVEITTAGIRKETSVGWKHHKYATEILEGIQQNERRFAFIAGADEEDRDKWQEEQVWIKANPNWGISVNPKQVCQDAQEAVGMPSKLNDFLRYHLNFWVEQHSVWIPAERWAACRPRRDLLSLRGEICYGGLDMADTDDIASLELAFRDEEELEETYDIVSFFWMPEATLQERIKKSKVHFDDWVRQGYIFTTPGPTIDRTFIKQTIFELMDRYEIVQIWYDPAGATQLVIDIEDATGKTDFMVKCFQQAKHMHEPTKKIEDLVSNKNLRHGDNPVLRWMNGNVTIRSDSEGNIKIDKAKSNEKVDGMVAIAMALKGWVMRRREEKKESMLDKMESFQGVGGYS